jgi:hypothetical protein
MIWNFFVNSPHLFQDADGAELEFDLPLPI